MPTTTDQIARYHVDERDRLIFVDSGWDAFARDNGAPELQLDAVVGRPLLSFIAGSEMRQLTERMLRRIRDTDRPLTCPFRCDGPRNRRLMTLTMTPQYDDVVQFDVHSLNGMRRRYMALFDPFVPRRPARLAVCSWCKRVDVEGEWLEVEAATVRLELLYTRPMPQLAHGLCAPCRDSVTRELARAV